MNRDIEIIREFLLSLIQDPDSTGVTPSGISDSAQSALSEEELTAALNTNLSRESWDPLESELSAFADLGLELRDQDPSVNPVTHLGDVSAVQNRFQSLLKNRLRSEIERHPPLFPWEKAAQDYPDVVPGDSSADIWVNQLRELAIPAVLPDEILSALLERCQKVVHQSMKSGIKLIQAVEGIFPDQPQTLERVANMILQPAYRSIEATEALQIDFDQANPQQQVALAMLAAQEILSALSLKVSPDAPGIGREWLTSAGILQLSLYLDQNSDRLIVKAVLPAGGYLQLMGSDSEGYIERQQPGDLQLALEVPSPECNYRLEVGLKGSEARPLQFIAEVDSSKGT